MCHQKVRLMSDQKMVIALADPNALFNKRTELISKCCHRNKFIMKNIK